MLHDRKGKGLGLLIGMAFAGHVLDALIKAGITQGDGGVTAEEQLVDGFALLQSCQSAVLPQDGSSIGKGAQQPLMTAQQRLEWLSRLIDGESEDTNEKLKAIDIMNKMQGEYVTKVEGTMNVAKLEDLI